MLRQLIDINGYWTATVIYIPHDGDMPAVARILEGLGCPQDDIEQVWRDMTEGWNTGYTWSNPARRRSVTLIGRSTSWEEFFNTVMHEIRHVVDDIAATYDVMGYGEPPAYLQGFIGQRMAPVIRRIACPCCGREGEK